MDNKDFLTQINETEEQAEKIIADARAKRRDDEKLANEKARDIIDQARNKSNDQYKRVIGEANAQGEKILSKANEKANEEALKLQENAKANKEQAVKKVVEGIVSFSVNR